MNIDKATMNAAVDAGSGCFALSKWGLEWPVRKNKVVSDDKQFKLRGVFTSTLTHVPCGARYSTMIRPCMDGMRYSLWKAIVEYKIRIPTQTTCIFYQPQFCSCKSSRRRQVASILRHTGHQQVNVATCVSTPRVSYQFRISPDAPWCW